MARVTSRAGLKLSDCDPREWRPFTFCGGPTSGVALFKNPANAKKKIHLGRISVRVSAHDRKTGRFRTDQVAGEDRLVGGDNEEEFESDELACFRGLVLDVSYRSDLRPNFLA